MKRAKRRGYLRNLAVALGNSGEAAAQLILTRTLFEEPEPLVRGHAAWALGLIGGEQVRQAIEKALQRETDAYVIQELKGFSPDGGD